MRSSEVLREADSSYSINQPGTSNVQVTNYDIIQDHTDGILEGDNILVLVALVPISSMIRTTVDDVPSIQQTPNVRAMLPALLPTTIDILNFIRI